MAPAIPSTSVVSSAPSGPGTAFRHGWIFGAIWLFYLTETVRALADHPAGLRRDVGVVALALFVVIYLLLTGMLRDIRNSSRPDGSASPSRPSAPFRSASRSRSTSSLRPVSALRRLALFRTIRPFCSMSQSVMPLRIGLGLMLGLALLMLPAAGSHALPCAVYIAAIAMVGLPQREGLPIVAVLAVSVESAVRLVPGWQDGDGYALAVVLAGAATWGLRTAVDRQTRLRHAQQEIAVADERNRIAADLHDILGHSLTVVAVKAELAQRLLDVDLTRARTELRDLEILARDALADVRATALGVRGISLPGEIAAARAALAAAGIEADLPGTADEVPTRNRELFAWTLREAVTNIVRHSGAHRATVHLSPTTIEILDDGRGYDPTTATVASSSATTSGFGLGFGQGLSGLRRRADERGARLTVGDRKETPGFSVRMEVP